MYSLCWRRLRHIPLDLPLCLPVSVLPTLSLRYRFESHSFSGTKANSNLITAAASISFLPSHHASLRPYFLPFRSLKVISLFEACVWYFPSLCSGPCTAIWPLLEPSHGRGGHSWPPWTKQGFPWQRELCGGLEKGFPSTPQVLFQLRSLTPRVSHGGVSNQGRKTVLSISNWCLETIVLHATGRKMWGEWVSEPGLELVASRLRRRGSRFHFCTQASLDLSSLGLQSVSLSLGRWENGKK